MSNIVFQNHSGNYGLLYVEYKNTVPYKYIVVTHTEYAIGLCHINWITQLQEKVLQPLRVDELSIACNNLLFILIKREIKCKAMHCKLPRLWCYTCTSFCCMLEIGNYWLNRMRKRSCLFHNNNTFI